MIRQLFTLLLCLAGWWTNALGQSIRGQITDEQGRTLEHVLVWIVNTTDSTVQAHTYTDAKGHFVLPEPRYPSQLHARSIGYSDLKHHLSPEVRQLGVLVLNDELSQLSAVEVVGERTRPTTLTRRAGRLTLDVAHSPSTQGVNAIELLRRLPGLTVDEVNKSISFAGRGNVLVLLDGRQTHMKPSELVSLLRGTSASGIESIELMTNPSVQYDAEGSGALINIITKRGIDNGLQVASNLGATLGHHLRHSGDLSILWSHTRLRLWSNYSHALGNHQYWYGGLRQQQGRSYDSHSEDVDKRKYFNAALGAEYLASPSLRLGLQLAGNFMAGPGYVRTSSSILSSAPTQHSYHMHSLSHYTHQHTNRYDLSPTLVYTPGGGQRLSLTADYSHFEGRSDISLTNVLVPMATGGSTLPPGAEPQQRYETRGTRDFDLYGLSIDYDRPLASGKLSLGGKIAQVATANGYRRTGFSSLSTATPPTSQVASDFDYSERILASYIQYERALGARWRMTLGLRAEHTRTRTELRLPLEQKTTHTAERSYIDFFPSAVLSYSLDQAGVLTLSLGRRIDRPQYASLNPIDEPLDGLSSWRGNPYLKPQKTLRTELSWQRKQSNLLASWTHTSDYFVGVIDTIGQGRTVMTPMNLGVQRQLALTAAQGIDLATGCTGTLSATVLWQENQMAYTPTRLFRRARWSYFATAQLAMSLGWGIRGEIRGQYYSRRLGGSTDITASTGSLDLSLQRSFMGDRLSVKLSATDLLGTSRWDGLNVTDAFVIDGYGHGERRVISLNCGLRLGKSGDTPSRSSSLESEYSRL